MKAPGEWLAVSCKIFVMMRGKRSRTGQSKEDDLLVGPLLGGVVIDGNTAGGDLAAILSPGNVAVSRMSV